MAMDLKQRINNLDDFQVVRFFNHFSQQVFEGLDADLDQVQNGIPSSIKEIQSFVALENLGPEERNLKLKSAEAALVARSTLLNLAEDATFAPVIGELLDGYQDNELVAETILAVGAAVTMILIASTTSVKFKVGNLKVSKDTASPELIKALLEGVGKIIPGVLGKN